MSSTSLRIGKVDQGAMPTDKNGFLSIYHAAMAPALQRKLSFRDEADGLWQPFSEATGTPVRELCRCGGWYCSLGVWFSL